MVKKSTKKNEQIKKDNIGKKIKGKSKSKKQQQKESEINYEHNFNTIDTAIVQFFNNIQQSNLVFDEPTRQILRKNHPQKSINIKPEYDFKNEAEQIKRYISELQIIKQLQTKKIQSTKLVDQLSYFFQQASKFFASQVTSELYSILLQACDIVFHYLKDQEQRIKRLRQLGDSIPSARMQNKYFYFGFNMFKLPQNKTEADIPNLRKHSPYYKYILKMKYRQQDGPFAELVEKIGDFLLKIINDSNVLQKLDK